MTDFSTLGRSVPARLGTTARLDGDDLVIGLRPTAEMLHHGVLRASVLTFVIDAVAGIAVDTDPDSWSFTTDLSMRMRPVPTPAHVEGRSTVVRRGGRSVTCASEVVDDGDGSLASGLLGFRRIPRREGDPPKPRVTSADAVRLFSGRTDLPRPFREEAGIEVVDPAAGVVQAEVTAELRNSAGTMQGAMVALVAEAAVEDLAEARAGGPMVVTELDVRYLARTSEGPVRSRCAPLDDRPGTPARVELVDRAADRVTAVVLARAEPV